MNRATLRLRAFNLGLAAAFAVGGFFGVAASASGLPPLFIATGVVLGLLYGAALGWAFYCYHRRA